MRVSNEEKERSRERILDAAGRLFRENGVAGASVGEIMTAASMTHGGFYRHFDGKDALLAAALSSAFQNFAKPLIDCPQAEAARAVVAFRAIYLSQEHLENPGYGCPVAALGPDIARAGDSVRKAYTDGVNHIIEGLSRPTRSSANSRDDALRDLAMMVGAVVLARGADEVLAAEILRACS